VKVVQYPGESDLSDYPLPGQCSHRGLAAQRQGSQDYAAREGKATATSSWSIPSNRLLYELYIGRKTDADWQAAQSSISISNRTN